MLYPDDNQLIGESYEERFKNAKHSADLLDSLGFTIRWVKSMFEPSQRIVFLGFISDSTDMSVNPEKLLRSA